MDALYENLDARVHAAEIIANEARSEFRTVSETLKKEMQRLKDDVQGGKVSDLLRASSDKKDIRIERWKFITAVCVQSLFVIGMLILNWERIESLVLKIRHAGETHIPLLLDTDRKPRRRHKRKPPPIIVPEVQNESAAEEVP